MKTGGLSAARFVLPVFSFPDLPSRYEKIYLVAILALLARAYLEKPLIVIGYLGRS